MTTTPSSPSYSGYRFPTEVISHAVRLYFHFPLSLRMVNELLAVRGIVLSHETVRQWSLKFGQAQRFLSTHDGISNLFNLRRHQVPAAQYRAARTQTFQIWAKIAGVANMT